MRAGLRGLAVLDRITLPDAARDGKFILLHEGFPQLSTRLAWKQTKSFRSVAEGIHRWRPAVLRRRTARFSSGFGPPAWREARGIDLGDVAGDPPQPLAVGTEDELIDEGEPEA